MSCRSIYVVQLAWNAKHISNTFDYLQSEISKSDLLIF